MLLRRSASCRHVGNCLRSRGGPVQNAALQSSGTARRVLLNGSRPQLPRSGLLSSSQVRLQQHSAEAATTPKAAASESEVASQPPLLVRSGLVGAATALLTPVFPIIGFNQLVFRFCDPATRAAINGGTSMLYFSAAVLMPKAFYYAPLLLPFAVGNAVTAAATYTVAERLTGGPQALADWKLWIIPLAGPIIGLVTAILAPYTFPWSWSLVYPEPGDGTGYDDAPDKITAKDITQFLFGNEFRWLVLPCLATTGAAAGLLIDVMIRPLILGVPGMPWQKLAGGVLLGSALALGALYSSSMRSGVEHLREVDFGREDLKPWNLLWLIPIQPQAPCYIEGEEELYWLPSLDSTTGELCSMKCNVKGERGGYAAEVRYDVRRSFEKASEAHGLRARFQDSKTKCYSSRQAAYLDGMAYKPLDQQLLSRKFESLPVGETVLTDATVLLLAGKVPQEKIRESVAETLPLLASSSLVQRLHSRSGMHLTSSWASGRSINVKGLLDDLSVRVAQLRELHRLRSGAARGPASIGSLEDSLVASGVDVARATSSLKSLGWKVEAFDHQRLADWALISGHKRYEAAEQLTSYTANTAKLAASLAALTAISMYIIGLNNA
eukprot:TRINITY_DN75217_c0_g1_i1.p1 TRINITY_DN75217_c0_g1~~TRINITY_DN75217_c0_g1_i1.p1  ORF type:complete len:610 (+),score=47.79 TRINITY_DN75217_c0_g1_i1:53-1882(+)